MGAVKLPRKGTLLETPTPRPTYLAPDVHPRQQHVTFPGGSKALVMGRVTGRKKPLDPCVRLLHIPGCEQSWWSDPWRGGWKRVGSDDA